MKLEAHQSSADKAQWKIIRTDKYTDVPGEIVAADETTGECSVVQAGETKALNFGPHGLKIISRRR